MNSQQLITQLFVYGTLKPGRANYKNYCQGKTIAEIKGYTRGLLYHLPMGYPAITLGKKPIKGYLLSFRDRYILRDLDDLENYQRNRSPELNDYYRQQVNIYSYEDRFLDRAWCYFMTPEKIVKFKGKLLSTNWK